MSTKRNIKIQGASNNTDDVQKNFGTEVSCENHSLADRSRRVIARVGSVLNNSGRVLDKTGRTITAGGKASAQLGRVLGRSHFADQMPEADSHRAPLNISETEMGYMIYVALPGCTSETTTVTRVENDLWVKAWSNVEMLDETNARMHLQETKLGNWHRHIRLGRDIDTEGRITAKCCNGVLVICLPKKEEAQLRNVRVDQA